MHYGDLSRRDQPTITFPELVQEMVWEDLAEARRDEHVRSGRFVVREVRE